MEMSDVVLIKPHGGKLVNRVLGGEARQTALEKSKNLKALKLSPTAISDLELIAVGALSPLTGFMKKADYESVVELLHPASRSQTLRF